MTDRYSGRSFTDPQSENILSTSKARSFQSKEDRKKGKEEESEQENLSVLYKEGLDHLKTFGYLVELCEEGEHVKHRILKPATAPDVGGITYPGSFQPLRDIVGVDEFKRLSASFNTARSEVRDFWKPLYKPDGGDTPLSNFTNRLLAMERLEKSINIHEVRNYDHTFDPDGSLCGYGFVRNPRVWVPAKEWFDERLYQVKLSDVFTIFPEAELEMLKLLLGRIGVGRANHLPPNFPEPIDHTARMAGVIVGKDPGLGKSTIFNGLTAAMSKCGFVTNTFKSTEDRFGLKAAALANIAYKDDTSMKSLKGFLSSEETKILITNGLFQTEEKFQNSEQIWPQCVLLVNSNDWDAHFAYDLDPGIIDRIKILSTYREYEVLKNRKALAGTASDGTPDLRPRSHIPFLADKLGVSSDALYLWCLRLATDRFWEVISDTADPTVNRLQLEVRYWTTRQRIRFKSDTSQALVNAMAMCSALRTKDGNYTMPELTPEVLVRHLESFLFIGVDKSAKKLVDRMKAKWEEAGRPSTHYYQGIREIRWESVQLAIDSYNNSMSQGTETAADSVKKIMGKLLMRDGFKMSTGISYVIEDWNTCRYALGEIIEESNALRSTLSETQLERLCNENTKPTKDWLSHPNYSPDRAEEFRPDMD